MKNVRIIKYLPKISSAATEYREISDEDMKWLQEQMIMWLAIMGELDQFRDEDSEWVRDNWWHKRTKKLHLSKQGPNSPCSSISGMILNFMFKNPPQRDLSAKQMEDIEIISSLIAQTMDNTVAIRFQIGISFV